MEDTNETHVDGAVRPDGDARVRRRGVCAGWRRQQHRHDPRPRGRRAGRGAPWRHGHRDQPGADPAADHGDVGDGQLPLSGGAAGHLFGQLRAGRLQHADPRRRSSSRWASRRRSTSSSRWRRVQETRDRQRPVAGDRHQRHARAAELQDGAAAVDPQRPRHVGAAGGDAVGDDGPHRRRRQPRRHANRLQRLRPDRTGPGADRRHQHDRRARAAPASTSTTRRSKRRFSAPRGQSAEMPNPGVQSQFIARSGSNQFQGEYHLDWYNNAMQGSNIPDEYTAPTGVQQQPDPRAQQRDRSLLRPRHQRRRADQARTRCGCSAPTASSSTPSRSPTSSSTRRSTRSSGIRSPRSPISSIRRTS